ncbi:MAG: dynamin family protein [Anaerolineae bacterium]
MAASIPAAIPTVLTEEQAQIWKDERRALERLLTVLAGWDSQPDDIRVVQQALAQLDELFLLVIAGEFNSGKSALINALLGERYLAEGVTPTTAEINILRYGEKGQQRVERGVRIVSYPAPFLQEINLVDTPGTNAVLREHEEITREFVPRSDLVLFVTSADRPFTESERAFLSAIKDWGKKIVLVVNKIDIFETPQEQNEAIAFVTDNARRLLGVTPDVFPVSARLALRGKLGTSTNGGADHSELWWHASQFQPFEQYILETLNQQSRVRLKLLNPLGVGVRVAGDNLQRMNERQTLLRDDLQTIASVERQLDLYKQDMQVEAEQRFAKIDNVILEMRLRGEEFFDRQIRLRNIPSLLNSQRLADDFERDVVGDTPDAIEKQVHELIDWMVDRELREWRVIAKELGRRRRTEFLESAAQEAAGGFEYNRRELLESIGKEASTLVANYDRDMESRALVEGIQDALAQTALVEVGAVSLGVILHALLVGAAADATGILAASLLGVLGFAILPYKKSQAKKDLREKTDELRERLRTNLSNVVNDQLDRSVSRLQDSVSPYSRFIRSENDRLLALQGNLNEIVKNLDDLRSRVDVAVPEPAR